jgi:hypothetical protein
MRLPVTKLKKVFDLVYFKGKMIDLGFVGLASAYCHCKIVSIRREATLFLGLLLSTPQGLAKMQT